MTEWTVAHQVSLSMEFFRQEYWSGLPFLSPEELPNPGIELWAPVLQADSLLFKLLGSLFFVYGFSLIVVAQTVKNLPAVQENWVQSLGWEDPLEKGVATYSSILAWRILWTEEPGRLQSMGLQRVEHN